VGLGCVLCTRIDPLRFLAGCRRRLLNQGLVVALGFFSLLDRACFCVIFSVYGYMLCLVCYLFVISTSEIDCLGRFVPEMTYYVSSGTLNMTKLKHTHSLIPDDNSNDINDSCRQYCTNYLLLSQSLHCIRFSSLFYATLFCLHCSFIIHLSLLHIQQSLCFICR